MTKIQQSEIAALSVLVDQVEGAMPGIIAMTHRERDLFGKVIAEYITPYGVYVDAYDMGNLFDVIAKRYNELDDMELIKVWLDTRRDMDAYIGGFGYSIPSRYKLLCDIIGSIDEEEYINVYCGEIVDTFREEYKYLTDDVLVRLFQIYVRDEPDDDYDEYAVLYKIVDDTYDGRVLDPEEKLRISQMIIAHMTTDEVHEALNFDEITEDIIGELYDRTDIYIVNQWLPLVGSGSMGDYVMTDGLPLPDVGEMIEVISDEIDVDEYIVDKYGDEPGALLAQCESYFTDNTVALMFRKYVIRST